MISFTIGIAVFGTIAYCLYRDYKKSEAFDLKILGFK